MFVKLNLLLICVFIFNISEVKSDCDDLFKCVGEWIGDLLVNDKKNDTNKAVEIPDVVSAVGDLVSDISHFIEDTFNLTKEASLAKNVENKTAIHVDTFTFNDILFKKVTTFTDNDSKLSNIIDKGRSEVNDTSKMVAIDFTNSETVSTTDNSNNNIVTNISDVTFVTLDDYIKNALSEEYLNNKAILPEISSENTGYDYLNFTTVFVDHFNVTYGPLNTNGPVINKTLNIENPNDSNIFINIPEAVANNYKITFESPINVTYFEISTSVNVSAANSTENKVSATNFTTQEDTKTIENQNVQENEIIASEYEFDDVVVDDNATDYLGIDYIDLYKDTTNEDVEYTPATYIPTSTEVIITSIEVNETNGIYSVFPWIATVFIKNNENNQFEYVCDGALLSDRVILTAARCVLKENVTVDVDNILVILGKRSLQETGPNEKVLRVKTVKLHENFTAVEGKVDNDLAIIVLAEPITFNEDIQPTPLNNADGVEAIQTATTGWHVTGRLTPIYFDKESKACKKNTEASGTFCAVFGDDITTCPSYGGLFIARQTGTEWSFRGITAGNPTNRGACFNKNVTFTNIRLYYQWIMDNIELNKV